MRPRSLILVLLVQAVLSPAFGSSRDDAPAEPAVETGPVVRFYGLFKLDGAYDTCRTEAGNFVKWVEMDAADPEDDAFNMTANQSRFGLEITELSGGGVDTSARFEIDFYGGGAENRSRPMLRHAFFKIAWPRNGLELLAGQTSDLFSPLSPSTLNYSVAWWAGNIGYRRPQVRLTKAIELAGGARLAVAGAIARTIGGTEDDFAALGPGSDAGYPGVQARVGLTLPHGEERATAVGLSSHWAREELEIAADGAAERFDSWSLNLDWRHDFRRRAALSGELFTGANLSAYLGGIGQGVNLSRMQEIGSRGGWIDLHLQTLPKLEIHLGTSLEDVDASDLEPGDRSLNRSIFTNGIYSLTDHARLGLEISHWTTEFVESGRATDLRTQFSLLYDF